MKRFTASILVIVLIFALCACGKTKAPEATAEPVAVEATAVPTAEPTPTLEIVYVNPTAEPTPEIVYVNTPAPTPAPTIDPGNPNANYEFAYIWADGSVHDAPEDGQAEISPIKKYIFFEPAPSGADSTLNCTVVCTLEDGKYLVVTDGNYKEYVFYIEGKTVKSLDGVTKTLSPGVNCTVYYNGGYLNPNTGLDDPQYVYVDTLVIDTKAFAYAAEHPKPTGPIKPGPTTYPSVPYGFWYGTDGMLHCYISGKPYHWANGGWVAG